MAGGVLDVKLVPNAYATSINALSIGTSTDTGAAQDGADRTFEIAGTNGDGNVVDLYDSQDNTTFFFLRRLNGGDGSVTIKDSARYLHTVRQAGTAAIVVQWGQPTASTGTGTSVVNGGQPGPVVVGTTDATTMSLIANNVTGYSQLSTGATTVGTTTGATGTTVQGGTGTSAWNVGTAATLNLGTNATAHTTALGSTTTTSTTTINAGAGGLGVGAAAPGASGLALDAPGAGTISLGQTNATTLTMGATTTVSVALSTGAGGTINVGANAVANTVNIATGAAVQGLTLGSTNTTSTTAIQGGSGATAITMNVGTAAGVIGIASAATATTVSVGNGAAAMTINLGSAGAGVKTINIGTQASANLITVGTPTAGALTSLAGPIAYALAAAGQISNLAGGGDLAAAAVVNANTFFTLNQTTGAQTITLPNPTGASAVTGRILYLLNIGSADFTFLGKTVKAQAANVNSLAVAMWDNTNTRWTTQA